MTTQKKIIVVSVILLVIVVGIVVDVLWGGPGSTVVKNYFPFGNIDKSVTDRPTPDGTQPTGPAGQDTQNLNQTSTSRLIKISDAPIAGASTFERGSATIIRYIEKGTGHVYERNMSTNEEKRVSNLTINQVQEAVWGMSGATTIARYIDKGVVKSFVVDIAPGSENTVDAVPKTSYLPDDMASLAVSPDSRSFFYLTTDENGVTGFTSDFRGKLKKIFSSSIVGWLTEWPRAGTITLTTKPTSGDIGALLYLDSATGVKTDVLDNIMGLTTTVSPDLNHLLYSTSQNTLLSVLYNVQTKKYIVLPNPTMPEKCAWSKYDTTLIYCGIPAILPSATYPDMWYQGLISFTDRIWLIDTKTGDEKLIADLPKTFSANFDIIQPLLSKNEQYLFFTNKSDSYLWAYKIDDSSPTPKPTGTTTPTTKPKSTH